jgi:hypothetical protein
VDIFLAAADTFDHVTRMVDIQEEGDPDWSAKVRTELEELLGTKKTKAGAEPLPLASSYTNPI